MAKLRFSDLAGTWEAEGDRFVVRPKDSGDGLEALNREGKRVPSGSIVSNPLARRVSDSTELPGSR